MYYNVAHEGTTVAPSGSGFQYPQPMRWEDVPKIPEDTDGVSIHVRAPACPVDNGANWRQFIIAIALVVLMGWLAISAFTSDPIPWIPGFLALVGVVAGVFMLAGVVRSRLARR